MTYLQTQIYRTNTRAPRFRALEDGPYDYVGRGRFSSKGVFSRERETGRWVKSNGEPATRNQSLMLAHALEEQLTRAAKHHRGEGYG
jgi:hypothetical protein